MKDLADSQTEEDLELSQMARETGTPVGTIACPHCGIVSHGAIKPYCTACEQMFWKGVKLITTEEEEEEETTTHED